MATERFDIEIRDNVAKSIRQEILGIGQAARDTHQSLRSMKAEMATMTAATASSSQATNTAATASSGRARAGDEAARAMAREKAAADALARSYAEQARQARAQQAFTAFSQRNLSGKSAASSAAVFNEAFDAAAVGRATAEQTKFVNGMKEMNRVTPLARQHLLNLGFQLQDVAVSLQAGQNPLTVFIQQGGQIGQIAAQSGVGLRGLAVAAGRVLAPFLPLVAAAGALTAGFALMNREANKNAGSMQEFANGLGLTRDELKQLEDVTVTWGDTAKAVFQVGMRNILNRLGIDTADIASTWNRFLDNLWYYTKRVVAGIYASFAGMAYGVNNIVDNLGDGLANDNPFANVIQGYQEAYGDALQFFDDVSAQAGENARNRLRAQAREMIADRNERTRRPRAGWNRAEEWEKANRELDTQIRLTRHYGLELERVTQLEQIARTFAEHKQPLNDAERQHLMRKIELLQMGRLVQEAMTAADEAAYGASRQYTVQQEALGKLLDQGAIDWLEYQRQTALATRTYEDATDALAGLNRELDKNDRLIGTYGRARSELEYLEQIRAAAEARGESIYERDSVRPAVNDNEIVVNGGRRLRSDVQDMLDRFREQQERERMASAFESIDPAERESPGSSSYILDHHREMYAEIQRLREQDVINETEAARRKQNLDRAVMDARLEHTSSILGQISQLQNSSNREVAALGKAAAIAQATIDGYRAVQAALAGPPGPPWSFAIAGVTAAMTAANVAKIAGIGFQRGGYTGDGRVDQVAGMVHAGEYVFDAAATRRLGVGMLDSIRRGTLAQPPSNDNRGRAPIRIVQGPGTYVEAVERTDGEIEIIAERVARRVAPDAVARDIRGNPNSRTSKAIGGSFGVKRADR